MAKIKEWTLNSLIIYPNRVIFHFDQIRNIIVFLVKDAVVFYTNRKDT